jgi:hypothetical protein
MERLGRKEEQFDWAVGVVVIGILLLVMGSLIWLLIYHTAYPVSAFITLFISFGMSVIVTGYIDPYRLPPPNGTSLTENGVLETFESLVLYLLGLALLHFLKWTGVASIDIEWPALLYLSFVVVIAAFLKIQAPKIFWAVFK